MNIPEGPYAPHTTMAEVDKLTAVQTQKIGAANHPKADSLIDRAHRNSTDRGYYLVGYDFDLLMAPSADNGHTTMVKATIAVREDNGETHTYAGLGDANKENCSAGVGMAAPRMAETRAYARALGFAFNIADAVAEEIAAGGSGMTAATSNGNVGTTAASGDYNKGAYASEPNWKFTMPGAKGPGKTGGLRLDDPTITLKDLTYWVGREHFEKGDSGAYDKPDPVRAKILQQEIDRRNNPQSQGSSTPAGGDYTPPDYNGGGSGAAAGGTGAVTKEDVAALMKSSKTAGKTWPQVMAVAEENFGEKNPMKLDRDMFDMLTSLVT